MEMLVATSIFTMVGLALSTLYVFTIRSFSAMVFYTNLDQENRLAMDKLTREIRQAQKVTDYTTNALANSITIQNGSNVTVTYSFDLPNQRLVRTTGDGTSEVLLTNCNLMNFSLYQRCPSNGNYGVFPVAYSNWQQTVKVIQLTWKTARALPGGPARTENIQTARIVLRKQQD